MSFIYPSCMTTCRKRRKKMHGSRVRGIQVVLIIAFCLPRTNWMKLLWCDGRIERDTNEFEKSRPSNYRKSCSFSGHQKSHVRNHHELVQNEKADEAQYVHGKRCPRTLRQAASHARRRLACRVVRRRRISSRC